MHPPIKGLKREEIYISRRIDHGNPDEVTIAKLAGTFDLGYVPEPILALTHERGLAINRFNENNRRQGWTITHIRSGMRLYSRAFRTQRGARRALNMLTSTDLDWLCTKEMINKNNTDYSDNARDAFQLYKED